MSPTLTSILPASIPSPSPDWAAIPLGTWLCDIGLTWVPAGFEVRTYAICIIVGMIVAAWIGNVRLARRGSEPGIILDIALLAVVGGIVGARIWHVVTHPDDYFAGQSPIEWFAVWNGGLAIFGGLLGGAFGAWVGCRWTGIRFWSFADAVAPGLLAAQALGRFGNYFNHELYGGPTDLPWGLQIESTNPAYPAGLPDGTLFHPTFLYEMLWNAFGIAVVLLIERQYRLQWGKTFALYLMWYGIGRSWFESIRIDPSLLFLGIRTNVWGAFAAIVLGLVILIVQTRRHPGREPGVYRPGREWKKPAVESDDTYGDDDTPGEEAAASEGMPATSGARATS